MGIHAEQLVRPHLNLVEQLGDAVVTADRHGMITSFNPAAEALYGYAGHEVIGRHLTLLAPAQIHDDVEAMIAAVTAGVTRRGYALALSKAGELLELELTSTPLRDALGDTIGLVSVLRDAAAERLRERQLTFLVHLLDASESLAVLANDRDGRVVMFNRGAERLLGYREEEAVGRLFATDLAEPEEMRRRAEAAGTEVGRAIFDAAKDKILRDQHITMVRKDGTTVETLADTRAVIGPLGEIEGFVSVARDLSEVRHAELDRIRAEARFKIAFEHAPIGLAITGIDGDYQGRWLQTNPELARMLGYQPGELDGNLINDHTDPSDRALTPDLLVQLREHRIELEKRFLHRDGHSIWTHLISTPVPNPDGGLASYSVTQIQDISERRHFESQLRHLAEHDSLTGLHNRRSFDSRLERVVERARDRKHAGALLVLDLDGLKVVNDRFGHAVGDDLVTHIAELLSANVRAGDFTARLGGDEFGVILSDCDAAGAIAVAEQLLEVVRTRGIIATATATARITTSIGVALITGAPNVTADDVSMAADVAMYEAKTDGRNTYAVFEPDPNRHRQYLMDCESWFSRLRRALDEDRFVLHAQPIMPICTASIPRFELLLRMLDDDGQLVPPGAFLLNAERFDLIGEIDRWVIRQAVRLLHDQAEAGHDISLTLNLSGKTMDDLDFAADLAAMLERTPIPPKRLVVEVTETAAIVNIDRARELARELRRLGCLFALDDFGAGFSSFHYLKHLEFDYLKIDGEFVSKLVSTETDQLLVRAVVDIARGLGSQTVAEFVEDQDTVELLRTLGVDYGQGYHLGMPAPVETLLPPLH